MKRKIVIAAVVAAALIGGGTATAVAVAGDDDNDSGKSSSAHSRGDRGDHDRGDDAGEAKSEAKEKAAEVKAAKVNAADAIAAALKSAPGTAVSAELGGKNNSVVWEVEVLNGSAWHEVTVDAATGKVTGSRADRHDDTARVSAALKGAKTTAQDAARAAAAKGTVTEIGLGEDGKTPAWEAETTAADGTASEWRVDLGSGAVTQDSASHDDKAKHDRTKDDHARGHEAGDDDHGRGHDGDDD
ncbi:PepSY domain-containing protein [Streptomyces sp. NPDC046821]|uniref:PepSY domain-containing protein n=1 Tax=Streptomyces sp. NPDC046821 TaxID=3154702 RepID=UPI00340F8681